MSSRAIRKALREQELERQLAKAQPEHDAAESADDEDILVGPKPRNAFDMLNAVQDEDDEESDSETEVPSTGSQPVKPTTSTILPKKKRTKKKKKKANANVKPDEKIGSHDSIDEDDIDKALREIAAKSTGDLPEPTPAMSWEVEATKLLAIEQKGLNPTNEMRSLFGNVALQEGDRSTTSRPQRRREINLQGGVDLATALTGRYSVASRGKELGTLAKRRNCFVQGKEEWPLAPSGGLSMDHVPTGGYEKQYNITHNTTYNQVQAQFAMAVASMQPEQMISLLVVHPYHISSLLQVSEIAKHQGDASVAGDLIERALFSFGRTVHSSFPAALRQGVARLSFDRPANRELYLSIWRYIRNLEMRGTWRTAFEWSKVLLQLNTLSDPYGVTLMIDQLALRGRQHQQLLDLASDEAYGEAWKHLPNIQISLSLALMREKKPKEARRQLAVAMHSYPYILSALASSLEIQPLPKSLWGKLPSTEAEKLYTELYITRARDLWNTPETTQLISEVAETLDYYKGAIDAAAPTSKLEISLEEARHIMLLETPSLIALLPRHFTQMPTSSSDVLPPPGSSSDFTARAPNSAHEVAANPLQTLLGLAGSTATAPLQGAGSVLNRFLNWFQSPAGAGGAHDDHDAQSAIQQLRQELREANGGADVPDDVLNSLLSMRLEQGGIPNAGTMIGGWDYYEDAANAPSDGGSGDGEFSDIEDTPAVEPQGPRNPRAATVEEEQDDEEPTSSRPIVTGGAVLRRAESDDEDDPRHSIPPTQTLSTRPNRPTGPSVPDNSAPMQPEDPIDSHDFQRIQRYLITTGLSKLTSSPDDPSAMAHYIERLRVLHKNQQDWVISIAGQRAGKQLADKIRTAL